MKKVLLFSFLFLSLSLNIFCKKDFLKTQTFSSFSLTETSRAQTLSSYSLNSVDFSWETLNSYTPPLYDGRPLPGEQSNIKLSALPNIDPSVSTDQASLYYEWYLNDIFAANSSGINKKTIIFDLDQLENTNKIELKLYQNSTKENILADRTLNISPYQSLVLIYKDTENHLLKYGNAINKKYKTLNLKKGESLNLVAEPFYFSTNSAGDGNIGYAWKKTGIDGLQKNKNSYSISTPEYSYGNLSLTVTVSNSIQFLQKANSSLSIELIK
jgi:hypothetical protein